MFIIPKKLNKIAILSDPDYCIHVAPHGYNAENVQVHATDGHAAIRATWPATDPGDYPVVPGWEGEEKSNGEPLKIPADAWEKGTKGLKSRLAIIGDNVAVSQHGLYATNLDATTVVGIPKQDDIYLGAGAAKCVDELIDNSRREPRTEVYLDLHLLRRVLDALAPLGDKKRQGITFSIPSWPDPECPPPTLINLHSADDGMMTDALIMPMKRS